MITSNADQTVPKEIGISNPFNTLSSMNFVQKNLTGRMEDMDIWRMGIIGNIYSKFYLRVHCPSVCPHLVHSVCLFAHIEKAN